VKDYFNEIRPSNIDITPYINTQKEISSESVLSVLIESSGL